jgi:hypothetical protein
MKDTKQCALCKKEFELCAFSINKRAKDGFHAWCKVCCRKAEKERYNIKKQDRIKEVREWQARNLEKVRDYKKNWRAKQESDPPTEG